MPARGAMFEEIQVVDSHTAGEPTRVVIAGAPDLGSGSLADRRQRFARQHDDFRSAVVNEPRGSDVLVGALLVEPVDSECAAGVIFFNNVGTLGMCGHGTIGLVATLGWLGRLEPGAHRIETPVGVVGVALRADGRVTVENVRSYRHLHKVTVDVPGYGAVSGDVAWGGNWFFLADAGGRSLAVEHRESLTRFAVAVRAALAANGIAGADGQEIDHIELFGPSPAGADSRNFVLCPGLAYDRSPCGTGTSAKLACLAADGKLAPGVAWRQEGILGTVFEGSYRHGARGEVIPSITGSAYITGESRLLLTGDDPFRMGIPVRPTSAAE
ncbi:MAG TPA: proline racemase family protein [Acidobacteriaceae bacterium]|nr:proline racemase family protein [Acidobacteriaceae bacterium]